MKEYVNYLVDIIPNKDSLKLVKSEASNTGGGYFPFGIFCTS